MESIQITLRKFSPDWAVWQKIGRSIGNWLFLSPADDRISYKKSLCLTIEKGEIQAALGSRFLSRIKIIGFKKYPSTEGDYPPPNFLTSSLALAVAELGVEKTPVTLSIPKAWAVIKTVDYPSTVLENVAEVMTYELDKITPFTPEKAYYDFKVLKEEAGRVFILVAAARADLIEPYLKALHERGFKVEGITINLLGLGLLCQYGRNSNQALFMEIDKDQYEGALLLSNGDLKVFSGFFGEAPEKIKVEQIEEAIESQLPLLDQKGLQGGIIFYLKDNNPTLKESIKIQMRRTVHFLDESDFPFGTFGKGRKQIPYAAVGGILESLWAKSWDLNLSLKGFHRKSKPPWVITLLLLLTLGVLVGIYWTTPVEIETKRLHNLDKQIVLKKAEVKKVDNLKKEIEAVSAEIHLINDFKQTKPLDLNILKELTLLLPKNAWLTRMRVFENQVSIEGYAPSATLLIPKLEGSKFFTKVEFSAPTFKDPRQNMDRFQLKMELKSP
jgi:Tfp pilus assembly protein PilN